MEDDFSERTMIVEEKIEPRKLMILPPSFEDHENNNENANNDENLILDSLPYIERYNAIDIARAEKMVKDEMKSMEYKDYLQNIPMPKCPFFENKEFENEIIRIENKESILDNERYLIECPKNEQIHDISNWNQCLDNGKAQFEHEYNRKMNLEIMKKYICQKWITHNKQLNEMNTMYEKQLKKIQNNIDNINRERKNLQNENIHHLNKMEKEWWNLVSKNNEIELQCNLIEQRLIRKQMPKSFI